MSMRALFVVFGSVSFLAACSGPPADGDASSGDATQDTVLADGISADTSTTDGNATDVHSADASSDAAQCNPSDAGALQTDYYCDLGAIHVMRHSDSTAGVIVQARVGTGTDSCGAIDSVDILRGSTMLAHLGPSTGVALGSQNADIATGDAPTALVSECTNETTRLSAYGLVIRGRDANGPFEARCGTADTGGRWPPGTALLCHQNLTRPPTGPGMMELMNNSFGTTTMLYVNAPHAAGQPAATSVDSTVRFLSPEYAPFASGPPLMSADSTTGWMGAVSEGNTGFGPSTQIALNYFAMMPPFDTNLCPPPSMPGPGFNPPPWFIARVTGQGASGAVAAEVLTSCVTLGP